jgi:hypothetical protein
MYLSDRLPKQNYKNHHHFSMSLDEQTLSSLVGAGGNSSSGGANGQSAHFTSLDAATLLGAGAGNNRQSRKNIHAP